LGHPPNHGAAWRAPKVSSVMGHGRVSPLQPTRRSGGAYVVRSLAAPDGNTLWRIIKATERSFLHVYVDALNSSGDKTDAMGAIALAPT